MAVLLGSINDSGKTIIAKIKRMYSSVPSADYERYLFLNANHRNPKVRKFVRERLEIYNMAVLLGSIRTNHLPEIYKGGYYYSGSGSTKEEVKRIISKLGKPKNKTKIVKYDLLQPRTFMDYIKGRTRTKGVYVLFVKD